MHFYLQNYYWITFSLFLKERLEQELKSVAKYRKYWNHIKRKEAKAEEQVKAVWVWNKEA